MFAQVLSAHGVYLRTAGVEAAEQIGRCERHGGIIKQNLSLVVTACGIKGKAAMKMAAATCVSAKKMSSFAKEASRLASGSLASFREELATC